MIKFYKKCTHKLTRQIILQRVFNQFISQIKLNKPKKKQRIIKMFKAKGKRKENFNFNSSSFFCQKQTDMNMNNN